MTKRKKLHVFRYIFTARKRGLGQGNIFAPVCHSVHGGEGGEGSTWAGTPPPMQVLPKQVHPLGQVHPPGRYTPWVGTPPVAGTPPHWAGTSPREQCMLGDTGNKRAARILLECIQCILVKHIYCQLSVHSCFVCRQNL